MIFVFFRTKIHSFYVLFLYILQNELCKNDNCLKKMFESNWNNPTLISKRIRHTFSSQCPQENFAKGSPWRQHHQSMDFYKKDTKWPLPGEGSTKSGGGECVIKDFWSILFVHKFKSICKQIILPILMCTPGSFHRKRSPSLPREATTPRIFDNR